MNIDGYAVRTKNEIYPAKKKMSARADISGVVFGRLTVISDVGLDKSGFRYWKCDCSCGGKVVVRSHELKRGHTKSCGCLQAETRAKGGMNILPYGQASANELFASYKKSASSRGYSFRLTRDEFLGIVDKPCTYCGSEKSLTRKPNKGVNGGFRYTGIDRIDNSAGYVKGNVAPCCWICNRAKGTLSDQDFRSWINSLMDFNKARFEYGEAPGQ